MPYQQALDPRPKRRISPAARDFSHETSVSLNVSTRTIAAALGFNPAHAENLAIARGLKRQNSALLDSLIEQYQHRLMRYLLFLTGSRELSEDLFQETWIRVLLRGSQYNGKARFDTWLFTIARHLVIDVARKRTLLSLDEITENHEGEERALEWPGNEPSPFDQFAAGESRAEVNQALLRLEPPSREVLLLRFYEELSLEEIAGVTGAPLSTIKSRLYRGIASLRPVLAGLRRSEAAL